MVIFLGRREALEKSQRTNDVEITVTGSSTPSANSSSSLNSVGQESSNHIDNSISSVHHLTANCSTANSSSRSDSSPSTPSEHSPNYSQQPLALTTNGRLNASKSLSSSTSTRKETFPINPHRQSLITSSSSTTATTATSNSHNNNNSGSYVKI